MPVSRRTTEAMANEVAASYGRAEVRLLSLIARHLEAGHDAPHWAEVKLAELQLFRRRAAAIMESAESEAVGEVRAQLAQAYLRGAAAGQGDLERAGKDLDLPPQQAERAISSLAQATTGQLEAMRPMVLRQTEDAYRRAVARAVSGTLSGATTRLQDAQVALDDLARQGITGFVDKAGRRWRLTTYADMATRTATAQAAVNGHLDRLEQAGIPLVLVSNSSRECELCRPWEGKVLSRGPVSALQQNVVTGAMESVHVDGTLSEAMGAGLMHPNCTHSVSAYVHGATKRGGDTENAEGYAEKVEQRRLERQVRAAKERQAVAVTPEAKRKAAAKVRESQAAVKAHTDATGLPRKLHRERLERLEPLPGSGGVSARKLPEFYGPHMTVTGGGPVVKQHLDDLGKFSEATHTTLRDHFRASPGEGAGFYIGDAGVPELDDLGHLRGVQPRGWAEGETWDTVPGAYNPANRVCACGGGGHGHGATSLALHEGSHALDDALGTASNSPEFVAAFHDVHNIMRLSPYFTHPGNPSGYLSEGFAEGFAAYSKHRTAGREGIIDALGEALAGHVVRGPQSRATLGKLADYFSGLERSMLSK